MCDLIYNILAFPIFWSHCMYATFSMRKMCETFHFLLFWYQLPRILCRHRDNSCEVTTTIRPTQILTLELFVTPFFKTRHIKGLRAEKSFYLRWQIYTNQNMRGIFLSAFMTIFMRVFMGEGGLFGQISREGVGSGNWSVPYNTDIKLS